MKLSNFLTRKLTIILSIVFVFWAVIYYLMQIHVIHNSTDEGLLNIKQEFILEANTKDGYIESMLMYPPVNMRVRELSIEIAKQIKEQFVTTDVFLKSEEDQESVRMLTSAFYCDKNEKYYLIQFYTSAIAMDDMIYNIFILLVILLITIMFTLWIGSKIIISKSSKPFFQLLDNLKKFELNSVQMIELPNTKIVEYQQLNNTVEKLLKKNISVYEDQKFFIENSSHEIQTPLAIISAKVEMMLNDTSISENNLTELSSIYSNVARMKRLNKNLLLLSKIKGSQFIDIENVSFDKEIRLVLETFESQVEYRNIEVVVEKVSDFDVNMNKDLAYILLSNLVKNAINYNIEGGKILINISKLGFEISNSGQQTEQHIDIFERYKSLNKSTGLGLSIVKSIIELYHLTIKYQYSNAMHKIIISK